MIKRISTLALLVALFIIPTVSQAWGIIGHHATARIAERYMTPAARAAIKRVLGEQTMSEASTWMDDVRRVEEWKYMADFHYLNVADNTSIRATTNSGKIMITIEEAIRELKKGVSDPDKERLYVRMLFHLIGDLHQPLHVGKADDRGGNDTKVNWYGTESNLHWVWDSLIIEQGGVTEDQFMNSLEVPSESTLRKWRNSDVWDWAQESMSLRHLAYRFSDKNLSNKYRKKNLPIVRMRVLQAGIRMAEVFNSIYH